MQSSQPTSFQTEFTIQSFFKSLNEEGRLTGTICRNCASRMVPPRPVCSKCFSSNLRLFDLQSEGRLVGFSEIHVTNDAFQALVPYVVGIAEFDDGVKIPGVIKGTDFKSLRVGDRIRVRIRTPSPSASAHSDVRGAPAYWFTALIDKHIIW